jgi:hypothetical protein
LAEAGLSRSRDTPIGITVPAVSAAAESRFATAAGITDNTARAALAISLEAN